MTQQHNANTDNKQNSNPPSKRSNTHLVRLNKSAGQRLKSVLNKLNKKEFGKRISASDLIEHSLGLIKSEDLKTLQQESYSSKDLLEIRYLEYCKNNKKVSKDQFLGLLLEGLNAVDTSPQIPASELGGEELSTSPESKD